VVVVGTIVFLVTLLKLDDVDSEIEDDEVDTTELKNDEALEAEDDMEEAEFDTDEADNLDDADEELDDDTED
jgi:hypothetical protein